MQQVEFKHTTSITKWDFIKKLFDIDKPQIIN